MLSIRSKLFKSKKGFTLIELIVVIAILAILAVLAVPRFLGTLEDARYRAHNANVKTLTSAAVVAIAELGVPDAAALNWDGTATNPYIETWPDVPGGTAIADGTIYEVTISTTVGATYGDITVTPGLYEKGADGWEPASN